MKIQIILGSTRPGRLGEQVAQWSQEVLSKRDDAEFELVDVADFKLPLLDEPVPAAMQQYKNDHTKKWSEKINQADGYIIVSAEYNHSVPGALKNAIDYLNHEWNNKSVGFVSYGSAGGVRAVEHLRGIAGELQMADVREQLTISLMTDFENWSTFKPTDSHAEQLNKVADQVLAWSSALQTVRTQ